MAVIGEGELEINGGGDAIHPIGVVVLNDSTTDSDRKESAVVIAAAMRKRRRNGEKVDEGGGDDGEREGGIVSLAYAGGRRDPLDALGWDLMMKILSYIDAHSVALSLVVCRGWHGISSSDRLWSPMCKELWIGKAHIPRCSLVPGLSKLETYARAMLDGNRSRIRREDLCDHAWEFHFTKGAPEYWKNLDPYWKGTGAPMRRHFHSDGSQSADPGDVVWGGHECCYTVVTGVFHDGSIREHYVRINRWPQLCVSRRTDGGWEMANILCAYSSIPDAYKQGGTGPLLD